MAFNQSNQNAAPLGELVTANNVVGWQLVQVALLNTTAKVWTHTINTTPQGVLVFSTGGILKAVTQPVVTTNNTDITLTPTSSVTVQLIIMWSIPTQFVAGIAATNFV